MSSIEQPPDGPDSCPNCGDDYDLVLVESPDVTDVDWDYDRMCRIGSANQDYAGWLFYHGVTDQ